MTEPSDNAPRAPDGTTMPLAIAAVGQEVVLAAVDGGAKLQHRLAEMGLMPGARFKIINNSQPGPFIILVKDTRLVLGRGMVHAVTVRPVD